MSVVLEIDVENVADFFHDGFGASLFIIAVHIVTPVDFVDFAGSGAGRGGFEIARETNHGDIASFLVKADSHNRIGELGAVVGAFTFVAFHIVAAGTKG